MNLECIQLKKYLLKLHNSLKCSERNLKKRL